MNVSIGEKLTLVYENHLSHAYRTISFKTTDRKSDFAYGSVYEVGNLRTENVVLNI